MKSIASDKNRLHPLAALLFVLFLGACAGSAGDDGSLADGAGHGAPDAAPDEPPMDFGEDWDSIGITWMPTREGGALPAGTGAAPAGAARDMAPGWRIVLQTFTGDGHAEAAAVLRSRLPLISPRLGDAQVYTTPRGSMVVWGRYEGLQDERAQADKAWLKSLAIGGQRVFPRVMVSRVGRSAASASQYALMSARRRYPNVDPLYTLQVAIWGVFGGAITWDQARTRAEARVRELRAQGLEAFVHHNADRELSMVTVGLFDHHAIDPRSGLFSDEVETLLDRFPIHMVNGESVEVPLSRRNPSRGTRTQAPMLVTVPRM